jgi:hypothetical protein
MFLFLLVVMGCQNSPEVATSPEECMAMKKSDRRDDCWAQQAVSLFKSDEEKGLKMIESQISDPKIADYIWLTVTREHNPMTQKYCDRIRNGDLKERCLVLVRRPHLHRDILRDGTESSEEN